MIHLAIILEKGKFVMPNEPNSTFLTFYPVSLAVVINVPLFLEKMLNLQLTRNGNGVDDRGKRWSSSISSTHRSVS
jgi:hypothetical protein